MSRAIATKSSILAHKGIYNYKFTGHPDSVTLLDTLSVGHYWTLWQWNITGHTDSVT